MSYEQFYNLQEQPFSNTPDPRFYYDTAQHSETMFRLMYAIDTMKGLAVLIGDVGTGKTTLARKMLDQLDDSHYESALLVIIHSAITPEWLLRKIAMQLGVEEVPEEKVELLSQLYQRLTQIYEEGKKAVVLVDEANMLQGKDIMEEFRGLLNLEVPGSKLITFIFFGLPELEGQLALDPPLAQRVALKCRLTSLKLDTTKAYIRHRLKVAGAIRELFTEKALELIHHCSQGIPRLINTICDNALLEGYLLRRELIEAPLVRDVAMDLGLLQASTSPASPARTQ